MAFIRVTLLAVPLALAGCGGSDGQSAERWAGSVCAEVNDWLEEVDATLDSVADRGLALGEDDLRTAADRVTEATDELGAALEELGPPETESGSRAQDELETLTDELRGQIDAIEGELEGRAPLEAVATVATALAAAASQLQEAFDRLEGVDPELEEGFRDADECEALRERTGTDSS